MTSSKVKIFSGILFNVKRRFFFAWKIQYSQKYKIDIWNEQKETVLKPVLEEFFFPCIVEALLETGISC